MFKFAMSVGCAAACVFGLLLPWLWGYQFPKWPWLVLVLLGAWGLLHPTSLSRVYRIWMRGAEVLGAFNNRLVLGVAFFLIVLPVGRIRRLLGKDPFSASIDAAAKTYKISASGEASDMTRLF